MANIDRNFCSEMRHDLDIMLQEFFLERGMTMKIGNIHYDSNSLRFSISAESMPDGITPASNQEEWEKSMYERDCELVGAKKEWYGAILKINGTTYQVCGIRPNGRKNVIRIRRMFDKHEFVCSVMAVEKSIVKED